MNRCNSRYNSSDNLTRRVVETASDPKIEKHVMKRPTVPFPPQGPPDFAETTTVLFQVLSRAQSLIGESARVGVSVERVVKSTLARSFPIGLLGRLYLSGPAVRLGPGATIALDLVFHELVASGVERGALSDGSGGIELRWRLLDADPNPAIELDWSELADSQKSRPLGAGLGPDLIERGIIQGMGGKAQLAYEPDGLRCRIQFPLPTSAS
jgi:two-component sensor histidine kinase